YKIELFENWHQAGDHAATAEELSKLVPCETALLERLLRHLASNYMLKEPPIGVFEPTPFTKSLLQPVFGMTLHCHASSRCRNIWPKPGIDFPLTRRVACFSTPRTGKATCFNYYEAHPREGESFNHVMGGRILETSHEDTPLVVDIGGNIGHDMERFRQAHTENASRLYLQDRPEVIKLSKCPDPVNKMSYDFFNPQPIKGSRVYYMHGVLHDWSDEPARKILAMQRDTMTTGYGTLLVHDHIAPREFAHPHTTAYDLTMMVMVAGTDWTEMQWEELLRPEGSKMVKIWKSALAVQGIIEAELV
ncbi:uncharacterized protein N7446_005727, partial [Penicillium canescens]|uniref:uncharacterized protein n=1 Tax=Penicillium canescens TaxID=5083 RepID=UPI0026DF18F9